MNRPTKINYVKISKQVSLLPDKDLKATVASMKVDAQAQFSNVIDIAEYREFWRKGKALVELLVSGPIMNLLRKACSDNSCTGKVYHEIFQLGKILQEEWYEMYVRPFHRELSLVGMCQFWRR